MTEQSWSPEFYGAHATFVFQRAADLVTLLAPKPGERVLDLACGTGELTAAIASTGATVIGVDSSAAMVDAAARAFPGLDFQVADGQALPAALDGQFDAVFSNAGLHWMLRAEAAAAGIARVLKPGGRLVAEFGGEGCVATVRDATRTILRDMGEPADDWLRWYFPSIATYSGLLERSGLVTRFAALFDRPTAMEGEQGLENWFQLFGNGLLQQLGGRRDDFIARVAALCRPRLFRDGGWVLDYVRLRVVAWKQQPPPAS